MRGGWGAWWPWKEPEWEGRRWRVKRLLVTGLGSSKDKHQVSTRGRIQPVPAPGGRTVGFGALGMPLVKVFISLSPPLSTVALEVTVLSTPSCLPCICVTNHV
ncbi:hypothetical protein E2C01_059223 [Portunus trituberculatus]|uniref:Uncharacterized protein n=1 Tax=Portunus trituberculatus TaxID=210409 RepID=A0A5B7H6Z7_PORTR|nr:hypothetical protein [Portunus trituberculatus]